MKKGLIATFMVALMLITVLSAVITVNAISSFNDSTPPVTTISYNPETPDGENDWYVSTVTVWLDATDDMSGVNNTYYSINSGDWEIYNTSIVLSEDSLYYITYFSVDIAGNMEFPKLAHIKIDQSIPFISLTYKIIKNGLLSDDILVIATASDSISGMERVDFYLNQFLINTSTGSPPIYTWNFTYYSGVKEIIARGYDQAGNEAISNKIPYQFLVRFVNHFPLLRLLLQRLLY